MKITDYINGEVIYDKEGQYFWIMDDKGGMKMLAELRGWGHIQNMFRDAKQGIDMESAADLQDEVGEWIAKTLTEQIKKES